MFNVHRFLTMGVELEAVRPLSATRRINWTVWLRTVHFYASTLLFAMFMFYGVTGFLANRLDWISPADADLPTHVETATLPPGVPMETAAVVAWAQSHYAGEVVKGVEDEGDRYSFRLESAWHETRLKIDKASRTASVTREDNTLAESLVNLHRGKHAGPWQKLLLDLTGATLFFVTVTGVLIGLVGSPLRRRRAAYALLATSIVVLVLGLVGR